MEVKGPRSSCEDGSEDTSALPFSGARECLTLLRKPGHYLLLSCGKFLHDPSLCMPVSEAQPHYLLSPSPDAHEEAVEFVMGPLKVALQAKGASQSLKNQLWLRAKRNFARSRKGEDAETAD